MQRNVTDFFHYLLKSESDKDSLRLIDIIYSKSHKSEVCIVQLIGKNVFPTYTAKAILSDKRLFNSFSREDLLLIKELDTKINEREKRRTVLEVDMCGTILLKDSKGNIKRYAEKLISTDQELLESLDSVDAFSIGYRVGYKDGKNDISQKFKIKNRGIKATMRRLLPLNKS
ncbi:hypothetical protein ACNVED_16325 (plasmid) [Legionella sp. D16C41]|uniref:hypothetical protein n=1 Tax=Legionella sp. D16C41 TaxID=3402688 RepID=UPI003AF4A1C8